MAISPELFNILRDEANENGASLSKVQAGDNPANVDASGRVATGLTALGFRDSSGNLVLPQLNPEGALPVVFDAGTTIRNSGTLASGSQTKDVEAEVANIALSADKTYTRLSAKVSNSRLSLFRLVWVDDVGVSDTITELGYSIVGSGQYNDTIELNIDSFSTAGATGTIQMQVLHTPLDKESDAYASLSVNEIA